MALIWSRPELSKEEDRTTFNMCLLGHYNPEQLAYQLISILKFALTIEDATQTV